MSRRESYMRQMDYPDGYVPEAVDELPREQVLANLYRLIELVGGSEVATLQRSDKPTRCDVATRRQYAVCADCGAETPTRFKVGAFGVCRACAASRLNAGRRAAA